MINWIGNLKDDCTADWRGLFLHAEEMDKYNWWSVYDKDNEIVASSNDIDKNFESGQVARDAAEEEARNYLK